jgi:multiple sugar transport system substrate-binding protein
MPVGAGCRAKGFGAKTDIGGLAMKNRWRPLVLFAVLLLIAAACTSEEASQPEGSGSTESGPVTLNLWIFEGEDIFLPTLKSAFQKEHPNITVKITHIPEESYVTKIDTALAAGSPPDIGYMYEARWMKAGRVEPLDDIIASQGIDTSHYNQNAASYCDVDGKVYCLGSYNGAIMLFYNKGLFDKAGLPYPSSTEPMTVDEYAALAAKLTQPNDDRSKYVWGGYADVTTWWLDWRDLFSEDGKTVEGYVNDAPTVHMYDVLAKMIRDGVSPSESDFEFFGNTDILATGQMAMTIVDNITAIPTLEKAGIDWGAAPVPVEKEGDLPWVSSWTDYWGVFAGSEQFEAAKEFVAFVGTEGNRLRAQAGGQPLDSVIAEEMDWAGDSPGRAEALQVSQLARPNIFLPANIFSLDSPLWDSFSLIVEGDQTAQQALDEAAPAMQESLDRAWITWEEI